MPSLAENSRKADLLREKKEIDEELERDRLDNIIAENKRHQSILNHSKERIEEAKEDFKEDLDDVVKNNPYNYDKDGIKSFIEMKKQELKRFTKYHKNKVNEEVYYHKKTLKGLSKPNKNDKKFLLKELKEKYANKASTGTTRKRCPNGTRKNKSGDCVKK